MRIRDWSSDVCSSDLLTRGWQGRARLAVGAQRHRGVGFGGPCLNDRHLAQVDLVEGPLFAVPACAALGHLEAEAHAAKVAARREGFHVPARLSVGKVEREGQAPAILAQPQRAGTGPPQHLARVVVEQGENIPAQRRTERAGGDGLDETAQARLAAVGGGISLDTPSLSADLDEAAKLHIAPGPHHEPLSGMAAIAVVTSSTETKALGWRTAQSTVAIARMLTLPLL